MVGRGELWRIQCRDPLGCIDYDDPVNLVLMSTMCVQVCFGEDERGPANTWAKGARAAERVPLEEHPGKTIELLTIML